MLVKGTDAVNLIYRAVSKELNSTSAGKELLSKDAHVEQRLSVLIAYELGLVCSHKGTDSWLSICTNKPRAKGLCTRHYQEKYFKRVKID